MGDSSEAANAAGLRALTANGTPCSFGRVWPHIPARRARRWRRYGARCNSAARRQKHCAELRCWLPRAPPTTTRPFMD